MDETLIEKYALANAIKYGGTAAAGNIIGQIIKEHPAAKKDIAALRAAASRIVGQVNALGVDEQRARLEALAPEMLEKKEHQEHDPFATLPIPADATVVTGFPPEPSKYLHIGHAKALLANAVLAQKREGTFRLRYDDTNPTLAKSEFYDIILKDVHWLGIEPDAIDYASDKLDRLHELATQLVAEGHAYVCACDPERIQSLRYAGEACEHREQTASEALAQWRAMGEGSVLRLKADISHKNTTMRDPTIYRVISAAHARTGTKHSLWPTYDFETCVLDGLTGVTHRIRSKEFEMRNELHNHIQTLLGLAPTTYFSIARFQMAGVETQGRVIRERIASGELLGWDDPSLATLVALRRRGFTPQALQAFLLSTGLTKSESTLTWDDLYVHNRRVLNDTAKRLFFVEDPVEITVTGAPQRTVSLSTLPGANDGKRGFTTDERFLISEGDSSALEEGLLYRLMDCVNFTKAADGSFRFDSDDLDTYRRRGSRILHYLPAEHESVAVTVLMPDKTERTGRGESRIASLAVGEIVQFERVGFCRLDAVDAGTYWFWFAHK